jgi:outer membrane protein OmpA-like peptidoglycan-associated protein
MLILIPFISKTQNTVKEPEDVSNPAPSANYWSVGVFGGVMQFNGDLSKNLWVNLYSNSIGYNVGLVATRQFNSVVGVRARIAYGMLQSGVENKFTWEYLDGNGTPAYITQSFKSTIIETDLQLTANWLNWIQGYKPDRVFSSYLIAGFGIDQSKGTKTDDILNSEISYLGEKDNLLNVGNTDGLGGSDLSMKAGAGIGFDININKNFSVPIEFYWRWQNSDDLDMTRGGAEPVVNDMYSSGTIGLTYKFGYKGGEQVVKPIPVPPEVAVVEPVVKFTVNAPANVPVERRVRETFPLRNYVFFDLGSVEVPDRYNRLRKDQVKDFKEDQLEVYTPKKLSGRNERQMMVYYNILNILGDRMGKNPTTTIKLIGASDEGPENGRAMAGSIKTYLVDVWGIEASRITVEGRVKPKIPSEQPGGVLELDLLRAGDRRVSIESSSPILLMEFQSGPDAPLKPVELIAKQQAPLDSYVTFNVEGANEAFTSWSLEIVDENGTMQKSGPYTQDHVSIPGKTILGAKPSGDYKITMIGQTKTGTTIRKEAKAHMVLWTPPTNEEGMRYSIIYEFNESKAIMLYEKYLTDIVTPKIPQGGKVIIHGHTDIIGDEAYNQKLSVARANDVRTILENSLSKLNRTDVQFEVYGFGEDEKMSPFENEYPEERFYNRTVIIDIVPHN